MYPHERSLVKRLADSPFALLGINSDSDREAIQKVMADEHITWPSWWNGGSTRGGIAGDWNVTAWPTIYVLDAKGTIRFKNLRGAELSDAIDALLKEMGAEVPPREGTDGDR